ncbi:hypothetical protein [Robbsia sp. KACC 23696]|uniref:hypothetical protein n=1 Tax=Robbsia sp. KACC 23696 TaxID=3149231 RepID=UPI00325AEFD8
MLLYQGIAMACFVSVAQYVVARYRDQAIALAAKDAFLAFLAIYAFVLTVPASVDRSASVRMIQHLFASRDGLTRDEMDRFYADDVFSAREVDKRLIEQRDSGTIIEQNGRFLLTPKGRVLAETFSAAERLFDCGQ